MEMNLDWNWVWLTMDAIEKQLTEADIRFVRLVWCDNANVIRAKAFHRNFLEEHRQFGIGISMAQQAVPALYDAVVPDSGLGPVGEVWLKPDWSTLQALPYAPGHARVMADLTDNEEPWPLCPRFFLRRMVERVESQGFVAMAAFEHEFYLLKRLEDGTLQPTDQTLFASTLGMDSHQTVVADIVDALMRQGIPVERYYAESGPGQQEIAIRYCEALEASDRQLMFRETVRGVALRHGLVASFLPKLFADFAGSGCHLHLSLWQDGQNLFPNAEGTGLSDTGRWFVAGILRHLPALMAVTTPSPNSYRRLQPHFWSGAYRCWGIDNREAAVRIPSNPVPPTPTHVELKTVDASANPYLALGAVLAAGLDGIAHQWEPGDPVKSDPGYFPERDRQKRGIDRLPANLGEAIAALRQDSVILDALGAPLAKAFLAVRQAEWLALKEATLEDEVAKLADRY